MSRESKATKEEIQRNRDEAYLNGWDDGYAEGFGKASVAQDAAVAAALERAEGIATAQEAQANKRQAEADDEAQTDFNAGVLFGTEIGARMIAREIRALITPPQSDALAAVRAEARREERLTIIAGVDYEASVCPCEEDAVVMRGIARLIAADFSYDDADAALAEGTA